MGVLYMPFFDTSELSGTVTFATAGETDVVVNLATYTWVGQDDTNQSSIFAHRLGDGGLTAEYIYSGTTSEKRFLHYARRSFWYAFDESIAGLATLAGWPGDLGVTFNASNNGKYIISYSAANVAVTFSTAQARNLFGFTGNLTGATSYTATKTPLFCIDSSHDDVMNESDFYEPDGIANHIVTDDGRGFGVSRTEAPSFRDWSQDYEIFGKVHRVHGLQPDQSGYPFTHQHLFEYCRGKWPFVLYGANREGGHLGLPEVYSLRTEGTSFKSKRATPGNGTQFHVPYQCSLEGSVGVVII